MIPIGPIPSPNIMRGPREANFLLHEVSHGNQSGASNGGRSLRIKYAYLAQGGSLNLTLEDSPRRFPQYSTFESQTSAHASCPKTYSNGIINNSVPSLFKREFTKTQVFYTEQLIN